MAFKNPRAVFSRFTYNIPKTLQTARAFHRKKTQTGRISWRPRSEILRIRRSVGELRAEKIIEKNSCLFKLLVCQVVCSAVSLSIFLPH